MSVWDDGLMCHRQCAWNLFMDTARILLWLWQSSRPASFSPASLTLWPNWLERWLATHWGPSGIQCNVPAPTTPLVFEPGLIAYSESRASAGTNSAKESDPLARSLQAGWIVTVAMAHTWHTAHIPHCRCTWHACVSSTYWGQVKIGDIMQTIFSKPFGPKAISGRTMVYFGHQYMRHPASMT